MALEGVLAGRDDDVELVQEQLDPVGSILYASLSRHNRVILATRQERRLVDHWCRINGLVAHQGVEPLGDSTVRRLRAAGFSPDLYIDANPERAATALKHGVPVMLFTRPLYSRAGHRPDIVTTGLQKPWAQVVAESQAQRAARALPVHGDDE
jgi:hypothetical protein